MEREHRRDRARVRRASSGGARAARSALEYYTGYLIELSLSVDNLFVFILIFQYFAVPAELQPRVLKYGIFGAIIMRGIMIALGALLLERFNWIIYVFGGILIFTGIRMFKGGEEPDRAGEEPRRPAGPEAGPRHPRLRGAVLHGEEPRGLARDPAPPRGAAGGVERPGLRHRQHPGHLRGDPRPLHRLQLEHFRDPGPAGALLRPGGRDGPVRPPEDGHRAESSCSSG